jgi:hypothetical protein
MMRKTTFNDEVAYPFLKNFLNSIKDSEAIFMDRPDFDFAEKDLIHGDIMG